MEGVDVIAEAGASAALPRGLPKARPGWPGGAFRRWKRFAIEGFDVIAEAGASAALPRVPPNARPRMAGRGVPEPVCGAMDGSSVRGGTSAASISQRHPGEGRDPGRQAISPFTVIPAKAGTHFASALRGN